MSETSIIGGLASALCLSLMWPFCFQSQCHSSPPSRDTDASSKGQYGIKGFLRTCPCLTALPGSSTICSTASNTTCDCGWAGENDHAYFGTDEEREQEEARERAMREAWANRILLERERQRILGGVNVLGGRLQQGVGQRVHGVTERIPLGLFRGQASRTPGGQHIRTQPGATAAMEQQQQETLVDLEKSLESGAEKKSVAEMSGSKRKSIMQGLGVRNLDDIVGGSRMRAPRPGSVLYDGAAGVESTAEVRRRQSSGVGRSGSGVTRSGSAAVRRQAERAAAGTGDPSLNRGTIANQTVLQPQYGPTAPMVIPSSMPDDELIDTRDHK
ncbi:hypothetical protein M408DRAFT_206797 [Serendipita vermifera MAFF 305830]|uniref:Uncharacterized protein n=1 Tax=Serendipita vermifera MAFF 305830 TaxID=933852 RepID=A0A0C2WH59_SERVB|nr:hypothetical protein M408DRAFT_206797 [Serendipita vermifera MAFF 305830]